MGKITGVDGKVLLNIDKSKVTASKLKCLESGDIQTLLQAWAVGDVDGADAQVWLMFQLIAQLMASDAGTIRPVTRVH